MFEEEDENLASVIEACRSVTSDKITERRKASEHLQKLLSNELYVSFVDHNSDCSVGFTWNDVFKAACTYLRKVVKNFGIIITGTVKSNDTIPSRRKLRNTNLMKKKELAVLQVHEARERIS